MKFSVIAVGNEVLSVTVKNTTTPWLVSSMISAGHEPAFTAVVPDSLNHISKALSVSLDCSELVILTGGLGPTPDDLTKDAVAKFLGLPMIHSETAEKYIQDFFDKRKIHMPLSNRKQALIPKGSKLLKNTVGTAPGIKIETGKKTIILLPGPPPELEPMWNNHVFPGLTTDTIHFTKDLFVLGMSESQITDILGSTLHQTDEPTIAPYASIGQIRLRISAHANSIDEFEQNTCNLVNEVKSHLGKHLFTAPAPEALIEILKKKGLTISTAESCTGGLVAKFLTDIPGVSACFKGSAVTYSNQTKSDILGVSQKTLDRFGAVSAEVAHEMVLGAKKIFGSDITISTTGIAGPSGGSPEKPVGLVYMAVATPDGVDVFKEIFHGSRADVRQKTMMKVFWETIKKLLN